MGCSGQWRTRTRSRRFERADTRLTRWPASPAVTATLAALFRLRTTGQGCHLVVSSFEAMATQAIAGLANIAMGGESPTRQAEEVREASIGGQVAAIGGVLPCNDGYVAISPREDAQWASAGWT